MNARNFVAALLALALVTGCSEGGTTGTAGGAASGGADTGTDGVQTDIAEAMGAATSAVVGQAAPDFELTDTAGNTHRLSDYVTDGKIVVLEWFNPDCPIVKHYHDSGAGNFVAGRSMGATYKSLAGDDLVWLAINSGAPGKQGAGLERNQQALPAYNINYAVLLDESGDVGKTYGATNTPHMFVVGQSGDLIYNGAIDNGTVRATGDENYVIKAVQAIRDGQPCEPAETPPFGCGVKYGS